MSADAGGSATEYKLVILGSGGVGKTAITIQFTAKKFVTEYDPTIEDSYRQLATVDGESCMLDILDTAGQEEYISLRDNYTRFGDGFLLVYDITNHASFEELPKIHKTVTRAKEEQAYALVLVGNKCDLESDREVSGDKAGGQAAEWAAEFMETTATRHDSVEAVFHGLVRSIRKVQGKGPRGFRCALL